MHAVHGTALTNHEGTDGARRAPGTGPSPDDRAQGTRSIRAVVVPHTHWDREWYAPLETMRLHLVRFLDELIDVLETDPDLPVFLLDGQTVMLDDYLEVRRGQRTRVEALIRDGRLRPGPNYVQPDEFHVSGESIVRNLLIGLTSAREYGWVMREGYLPDTFGHVHQLPQILKGFGIDTFYAMRGFGQDPDELGSQFWWEGPDGSRVRTEWLTESYSNAAVLTAASETTVLHHGALVRYDTLAELLGRMSPRAASGVLLLLNGGDHLHVQRGLPAMVEALDGEEVARELDVELRLGGLEEFRELMDDAPAPGTTITGELRYGRTHAVFDGIGSTRTPMKGHAERTESYLSGVAERLDALATLVDGRTSADLLRHAWRELVKNHAHDSISGCSVDEVHDEMETRFTTIGQGTRAVADDALARIATAVPTAPGEIPVVVVNPSGFARTGSVSAEVLPDLDAPVGIRRFGWLQREGVDLDGYRLVDADGRTVPHRRTPGARLLVADTLERRKELLLDRVDFVATDVPALGTAVYRLVPGADPDAAEPAARAGDAARPVLDNGILRVEADRRGTVSITDLRTGRRREGLLELVDEADAGDEYGHAPIPGDVPIVGADTASVALDPDGALRIDRRMVLPAGLSADRRTRSPEHVELTVTTVLRLDPGADLVLVDVDVDNPARDHRLRLRFPTGTATAETVSESAFGVVRRDGSIPDSNGWQDRPSGVFPMRRFAALAADDGAEGVQVLAEGLHEYAVDADGVLDVTLLRSVGWLARVDHALRPHKIGPEIPTPGAQCLGRSSFRTAVRVFSGASGVGHLYRAAEAFSVPLQAASRWNREVPTTTPRVATLGLAIEPAEVVLSAVKTAEDGDGLVVRVFSTADEPVTATLRPGFAIGAAHACDLEEQQIGALATDADGAVRIDLGPARIATVRLTPTTAGGGAAPRTDDE
ncbi:alpha-mannosidase [Agromyces sp. SYSU T0242]|uniref:alpha-mannosidase n=1 Tax=Agromyces litoreus TaxID=3158561 RepID=UPI0033926DD5